jgi:predicted porin
MKSGVFKRTALVAALATVGFAAHAEGFYFYALVDGGAASTKVSGGTTVANIGTTTEFVTGGYAPTFAGIKGEKSMDGVTGGFQLEQGFLLNPGQQTGSATGNTNNNYWGFGATNSLFNREANLYLSGDFGKIKFGTTANIAFSSVLAVDPRGGSSFASGLAGVSVDGPLSSVDVGAINYTTPTVNGFTAGFTFVPDSVAGTNNTSNGSNNSGARGAVTYSANGFLATLASFEDHTSGNIGDRGTVGGLSYKLGSTTFKLLAANEKSSTFQALNTTGIGGNYAFNAKTVADIGVYSTQDSNTNYKSNTFGFGLQYELFKGLKAYGQYANVKNDSGSSVTVGGGYNFESYIGGPNATGLAGSSNSMPSLAAGQTAQTINFGLLYAFF